MKLRNIFTSCCGKVDIKTRNNPAMDVWSITRGLNITVDVKYLGSTSIATDCMIESTTLKAIGFAKTSRNSSQPVYLSLGLNKTCVLDKYTQDTFLEYQSKSLKYHCWSKISAGVFALVFPEEGTDDCELKWCCRIFKVNSNPKMERLMSALQLLSTYNKTKERYNQSRGKPTTNEDYSLAAVAEEECPKFKPSPCRKWFIRHSLSDSCIFMIKKAYSYYYNKK